MNDDDIWFVHFQQNGWDAKVCHPNLQISGDKNLTIAYKYKDVKESEGWFSVFAIQPILMTNGHFKNFYFEILIVKMKSSLTFGFANKKQRDLFTKYNQQKGIYAYVSHGHFLNGTFSISGAYLKYAYDVGDVVGVGVNLAWQQIIFTKNGEHLASLLANNFADSSDSFLYPFVSLTSSGDQIEANFGPTFKFDLATLN